MPALLLYLDSPDAELIRAWLNQEADVVWLVNDGSRCKAEAQIPCLGPGACESYRLWHTSCNPVPLPGVAMPEGDPRISQEWGIWEPVDPWEGWPSSQDTDSLTNYHAFYGLKVRLEGDGQIPMSSVEWIGNYFGPAAPATKRWWERLRRWVKKKATRVPRSGPVDGPHAEVWAFPSALAQIASGRPRSANPL